MQNLPSITSMEVVVVSAAVVLLYVFPTLLAWSEARRRRRLERLTHLSFLAASEPLPASDAAATSTFGTSSELPSGGEVAASSASRFADPEVAAAPSNPSPAAEPIARLAEPSTLAEPPEASATTTASTNGDAPVELYPLSGTPRHRFRLDDLHQSRLHDLPPAIVRNDPQRQRAWEEAEHAAEQHRRTIASATIMSPYPARSTCLGAAEADETTVRLHFLLFPGVWPVSQNQAVAQAIFEIDRTGGAIHGWVDALRDSELTDDNRREIRESGGEA